MNKWLKGLILCAIVAAFLAAAAFLPNGPRAIGQQEKTEKAEAVAKQVEPAVSGEPAQRILYKNEKQWKAVVEKHYGRLTAALDKKDWGGIADLYGSEAVVYSKAEKTHFKGGHEIAFHFWKGMSDKKAWKKVIGFEIEEVKIFPVSIYVKIGKFHDRLNQLVFIRGKFKTEASPATSLDFEASWGHIDNCDDFPLGETV